MQHESDNSGKEAGVGSKRVPLHERPDRILLTFLFLVIIAVCVFALRDASAPSGLRALFRWAVVGYVAIALIGLWVPAVGNALFKAFRK